jgi:hypothetical protein
MSSYQPLYTCIEPKFSSHQVIDQLRESYWLESPDITNNGKPDLIGYGLTMGEIYWYKNPEWNRYLLANNVKMPVGMDFADITHNSFDDMAICYQLYGPKGTIIDPDPEGGKIDWLENPGSPNNTTDQWKRYYVGKAIGMHRIRIGHFTRRDKWQILGMPIVQVEGVHAVLPVLLFTEPDDLKSASEWESTIIDHTTFRFVHGLEKKQKLIDDSDLDSVLLAGDEGIFWLYYDEKYKKWEKVHIGNGEHSQFELTGFKGSGDVGVGTIGKDPFAFVVAVEPFHGNTIAAYYKEKDGHPSEVTWKRIVLDVFGDPDEKGEGPGHCVMCADFDQDGEDEVLVAVRGPEPWQGVFYYKILDARKGIFTKWKLSNESAARISVADFNGSGKLDFAIIGYSVVHYYQNENPKIIVYHNEMDIPGK